ncbi:hypothetical protein D3C76_1431400 [compost metagenome]
MGRQLTAHTIDPGTIRQPWIMTVGQDREILGIRQLSRDHRTTGVDCTVTLQPPGDNFGGGNAPLGEAFEVLPFGLDPWLAQVTPQALAGPGVALDVIIHAVALYPDHLRQRVASQALPLESKHRIEAAKIFCQPSVGRFQYPTRHQSAPP